MPQAPGTAQPPALTLDMLRAMPDAMREGVMAQAKEMMSQVPDMTASQMGIVFVQQEYERLGEDLGVRQNRYLVDTGLRMLLMAFLAMAAAVCVSFLAARMAARTSRNMRKDIYRKITSFNSEEFHRFSTASLITRSTNDVQQVQMFLAMGLRMLLFAPIMGIGGVLSNGQPHDLRAPDYDDWTTPNTDGYKGLNGDIFIWYPILNRSIELSSMGIRVDKETLLRQLELTGKMDRVNLFFHQQLLNDKLPLSIGGGIGQSRLCLVLLHKAHIGEIQASIWPDDMRQECAALGMHLI